MTGAHNRDPYLRRDSLERDGDVVRETLTVDSRCVYFKGHFDAFAIFPAVAQLQVLVMELAYENFEGLGPLREAKRVKFLHPIGPGARLLVKLTRHDARVAFEISADGAPASSGVLEFS